MTVYLDADGRDVASWLLNHPLGGSVDVEIGGTWHAAVTEEFNTEPDATGDPYTIASLRICGPATDPLPPGDVVITGDVLARVRQAGTIRADEWIRLRTPVMP